MSLGFILFFGLALLLILALGWALGNPWKRQELYRDARPLEAGCQQHVAFLPQVRQALAPADYQFLSRKLSSKARRRIRRERLAVAFAYLTALREDFESLLRIARVIAVLSPEVAAEHEFERLRLTTNFTWRYEMTRWKLLLGFTPLPQLDGLSELVSGLSVRMEAAMKDLGERAALAAEMASSINRRGVDLV